MSGLSDEQREYFNEYVCKFWDAFIVTQGGSIRRVTMPVILQPQLAWLIRPNTDVEPTFWDREACVWASRENCGYAEALRELINSYFDDDREDMWNAFLRDTDDPARQAKIAEDFVQEQRRRERLWREAHNEWRDDLPPAFD